MNFNLRTPKNLSSLLSLFICMTLLCSARASRRNCPPNTMARYKMEIQGTWTDAGLTGRLLPRGFPVQWRWLTGIGVSLDGREDPYYNETVRTRLYDFVKKGGLSRTVTELTQPTSGVLDTFLLPPLDSSVGESSSVFFVDTNHSHVSFMSRMNHKPHWILSMESVDLCHNGKFRDTFELDLFPFENKPRIVQRSNLNNVPQGVSPTPGRQSFSGYKKSNAYPTHNYNIDTVNQQQHQNRPNNQRNVSPTRKYFRPNGEPSLVALNTHNSVYRSSSNANGPIYFHNNHNGRADRQELVTPVHIPTVGYNTPATTRNQTTSRTPSTTSRPSISAVRFFLTMPQRFWTSASATATTAIYPFFNYPQADFRPEPMSRERLNRPQPRIHKSDPYIDIMDASSSSLTINATTISNTTSTTTTTTRATATSTSTVPTTKRLETPTPVAPTIRPRRPGYRFFPVIKSAPSLSRRRLPPDSENEISSSRNRRAVRYRQVGDRDAARGFISTAGNIPADFSQPSRFVPNTYRVPHSNNQERNYRQQTQPEVMPRLATVKFTKLALYHLSHVPGRRRLPGLGRNGQQVAPLPITIDKSLINSPHLPYPANPLRSPASGQFDRQRPSAIVNNESGSHLRRQHRLLTQPSYPF